MNRWQILDRESRPMGESEPGLAISPVLFIGLGGSGHRIGLFLKATLLRAYPEGIPSAFRLLVFDTDDENLAVGIGERLVSLERNAEFFHIGNVPVARIVQNLDRLPSIAERLPNIEDLPPISLRRGAKQIRPLGLLALLWHYPRVQEIVQNAIWLLAGRENVGEADLRVDPSRGITVFIAGSLVGGTHSGQFLDVAYLVRAELEGLGTLADFCRIIGVGLLPGAFRGIDGPNIIPNTVAALRELDHCMVRGGFRASYRNGHTVETLQPPFDLYYLVDAVDEAGQTWLNLEELCAMVAQGIFLMGASRMGQRWDTVLVNVDEVLSERTPEGHGTFLGSFGVARLSFPARAVAELCALRLACSLIEEVFLRPTGRAEADEVTASFIGAQGLTLEALSGRLSVDEEGFPIAVRLDPPAWLSRLEPHKVPQEAIRWAEDYRTLRLEGDFRLWIKGNAQAAEEELAAALEEKTRSMVNDPQRGPLAACAFLQGLLKRIKTMQAALETERKALASASRELEDRVEEAGGMLIRAPEANWFLRRSRVNQALNAYARAQQELLAGRLEAMLLDQMEAVMAGFGERAEALLREVEGLVARLRSVREALRRREGELLSSLEEGIPTLALVDEEFVASLYSRYAPSPSSVAEALLEDGDGLYGWGALGQQEISSLICRAAGRPFVPIEGITVEEAIEERGEMSPEAWKAALFALARPAWNLDLTQMSEGGAHLHQITILGVPDERASIFHHQGRLLASTHDPHHLTAFVATIGAPFTALRRLPHYLGVYQRAKGLKPLHVLPAFQGEEQEAKLAFALGLVFGLVRSRGTYFYYHPSDGLEEEVRLGQGAANALNTLRRERGLARRLMEDVEGHIEVIGIARALQTLLQYTRPTGQEDGLARELKRLVRSYAELLSTSQRLRPIDDKGIGEEGEKT